MSVPSDIIEHYQKVNLFPPSADALGNPFEEEEEVERRENNNKGGTPNVFTARNHLINDEGGEWEDKQGNCDTKVLIRSDPIPVSDNDEEQKHGDERLLRSHCGTELLTGLRLI